MKTEELIAKLANEARPVQPVASIGRRLVSWSLAALASAAVMIVAAGPRPDIIRLLSDADFLLTTAVILALALTSAFAALSFSVPNDARPAVVRFAPFAAAAGWGALLFWRLSSAGSVTGQLVAEPPHIACVFQISAVSILPALVLVSLVRRGAPLEWTWAGAFTMAAALGAGAVSSAIICPIDRVAHQIWWHLLPVTALALTGIFVGARFLDRFRPR